MAEAEITAEAPAPKKRASKLPLILGLVLALAGGGGGYYAVTEGLILGDSHGEAATGHDEGHGPAEVEPLGDVAFIPVEPLIVNLGERATARHLRFQAQIEVNGAHAAEVRAVLPRIVDVLNSYLRAVDVRDIEDRSALVRLRAQMLRRVQLVAGSGRVRDLLIMEFVLN
jgi:flagellar FliL protein